VGDKVKSGPRPYKPDWKTALIFARAAPRCRARCRRSRLPCRGPAMRSRLVCRLHGGKGGGPKGDKNGAQGPGYYTAEATAGRPRRRDVDPGRPTEGLPQQRARWLQRKVGSRTTGEAHEPIASPGPPRRLAAHTLEFSAALSFPAADTEAEMWRAFGAEVDRKTFSRCCSGTVRVLHRCCSGTRNRPSFHLSTRQAPFATIHRCCSGTPI
jgi:hypothetical protein